jgi:hypothetical protein
MTQKTKAGLIVTGGIVAFFILITILFPRKPDACGQYPLLGNITKGSAIYVRGSDNCSEQYYWATIATVDYDTNTIGLMDKDGTYFTWKRDDLTKAKNLYVNASDVPK